MIQITKKKIILLASAGIVLATLAGWFFYQKSDVVDLPKAGVNIIAFGDSLVAGYGATSGHDFVTVLADSIDHEIINAGVSGETTTAALLRLERDVLARDPRVVIILLGGNDALRQLPVSQTFQNLEKMIDLIHEKQAAVILLGIRGGIFGDRYKNEFSRLAREKKVNYIPDILDGILGNSELTSDQIHPNDKGYALISERIEPILRKVFIP